MISMTDNKTALRKQAEEKASHFPENIDALSPVEIQQKLQELRVHQIEMEMQNEDLQRIQGKLEASRAQYFDLFDMAPVGYCTLSEQGLILEANFIVATLLSVTRHELVQLPFSRFLMRDDQDIFYRHSRPIFEFGTPQACELRLVKKDGIAFWAHLAMSAAQDENGTPVCRVALSDITERKLQQNEREFAAGLIAMVNRQGDFRACMSDLTASLRIWSGCEAVGIRLRAGDDYPYYETSGFPLTFVAAVNHLCTYDQNGEIMRDSEGNPLLECMCGNILCGRFDPAQPYFTAQGSFWSNSTTALSASTPEADRQARTRTRCNREGYESVALIPLRTGQQVFGLLQFNDHLPNRFTPSLIAHFERMADSLAIALSRRQAEETLRETNELFSLFMRHSPIYTYIKEVTSTQSIIRQASDNFVEIIGIPGADMIGKTMTELFPPEFAAEIMAEDWAVVSGGKVLRLEEELNGRIYSTIKVPITWGDKTLLTGYTADITERKQAEEERIALLERLNRSEKMEALGTLAGGVAHDLNNVIGVLTGYSELLMERLPEGTPLKEYAANIFKSSAKGAAIIQDLLTLARRGVVATEVVDVNKIVASLMATPEFDRLKYYHPHVRIKTDLEKNLLHIKGSPVHLEKTVMNLASNAAEAITREGVVTIRTENRYLDKAVRGYDTVQAGEYVVLTVSDTGGGISSEDMKKMFEPFYTKKKMGRSGTGLGLAIVWGTVKDHEGYIDARSIEGSGTTFTLYFPVTRENTAEAVQKIPVEQYLGHGETVLVVDDVEDQRMVATTLLIRLGYQVHSVASGKDAVEYLKNNKADIMVLDMIMDPGIDGLETYRQILASNPHQKAIIVSGFSVTMQVRKARQLGAGVYVQKPYVLEKIGVAIRDELKRK